MFSSCPAPPLPTNCVAEPFVGKVLLISEPDGEQHLCCLATAFAPGGQSGLALDRRWMDGATDKAGGFWFIFVCEEVYT